MVELHDNGQKSQVRLRCKQAMNARTIEVSRDYILPDLYADIRKILSVTGTLAPTTAYTDREKAAFGGDLHFRVLLQTEDGKTCALTFLADYEGSCPLTGTQNVTDTVFMPTLSSVNARLVNPRKIGIKAKIDPCVMAWETLDAAVSYSETMTQADRDSFEEKPCELSCFSLRTLLQNGMESGDDIHLPDSSAPIKEILFCDVMFSNLLCEARQGAVAINADANVTLAYIADTGEEEREGTVFWNHTVPISCLVEDEKVNENTLCRAALYTEKVVCAAARDAMGEARVAELDFCYGVNLLIGENRTACAVQDVYSTRYECETLRSDLHHSRLIGRSMPRVKARAELPCSASGELLGSWADVRSVALSKDKENSGRCDGTATVTAFWREENGALSAESIDVPFSVDTGLAFSETGESLLMPEILKTTLSLSGGVLSAEVSLSVFAVAWENQSSSVVASAKATGESPSCTERAFTVYYPAENETLWEIAKKYRVAQESLRNANATWEDSTGKRRSPVIIPQKKQAIFKGVID